MTDAAVDRPLPVAAMTEIDGVVAVYAAAIDEVLVLSETASDIWRLLDGVRTEEQVVAVLAERYAVEPGLIAADVAGMVASFRAKGLLEGSDGGDGGDR